MYFPVQWPPLAYQNVVTQQSVALRLPLVNIQLQKWDGALVADTFGGKGLLSLDGEPAFAELVLLRMFQASGWEARWVETYGRPRMAPMFLNNWTVTSIKNQTNVPITHAPVAELLHTIALQNGNTYGGCWDIVAWKNDRIIFAELKRAKKDRMQPTQIKWADAALACGLSTDNFLIVEWDFEP